LQESTHGFLKKQPGRQFCKIKNQTFNRENGEGSENVKLNRKVHEKEEKHTLRRL
jgi:hypothetical protein